MTVFLRGRQSLEGTRGDTGDKRAWDTGYLVFFLEGTKRSEVTQRQGDFIDVQLS